MFLLSLMRTWPEAICRMAGRWFLSRCAPRLSHYLSLLFVAIILLSVLEISGGTSDGCLTSCGVVNIIWQGNNRKLDQIIPKKIHQPLGRFRVFASRWEELLRNRCNSCCCSCRGDRWLLLAGLVMMTTVMMMLAIFSQRSVVEFRDMRNRWGRCSSHSEIMLVLLP